MSKVRAPKARSSPPPDLHARILRASVELIEEEGLESLSMREVARRAGVSHQAPYHHFADREAILGGIAEEGFHMLRAYVEPPAQDLSLTPAERVAHAGMAYVAFACAHPAHFRIMFRPELVNLHLCPGALAAGEATFRSLRTVVHDCMVAGLGPAESEETFIALAWSVLHGLACLILDGPLAVKLPTAERDGHARGVMQAMGALIAGAIATATRARPSARRRRPSSPRRK